VKDRLNGVASRLFVEGWITARWLAVPRGIRDSCEGKPLKEKSSGTVAARNKAANFKLAKKPLRG
jgi:hypothetical protein